MVSGIDFVLLHMVRGVFRIGLELSDCSPHSITLFSPHVGDMHGEVSETRNAQSASQYAWRE